MFLVDELSIVVEETVELIEVCLGCFCGLCHR